MGLWGPSPAMLTGIRHGPIAGCSCTTSPLLPWFIACRLILGSFHPGTDSSWYPVPSNSTRTRASSPSSMEEVQPTFNAAFCLCSANPECYSQTLVFNSFMERSGNSLHTLQGMKIKFYQYLPLPHQICSDYKVVRGSWMVLQHRRLVCRCSLWSFKSLLSNSVYPLPRFPPW